MFCLNIFIQLLALLIVMVIGYAARLFGLLDKNTTKKLASFLMGVCYPLLMIVSFRQELSVNGVGLMGTVLVIAFIIHLVPTVISIFLFRGNKLSEAAALRFGTVFQSCGFVGYPLLKAVFGDLGAFYCACFVLFSTLYMWTVGAFMLSVGKKRSLGTHLKALANPTLIGAVVGVLLFLCRIKLPSFLMLSFSAVGEMAIPLSMIVLGSMLRELPLNEVFLSIDTYIAAFIKLIALPFAVLVGCMIFGISKWTSYICILMAALPTTVCAPLMAEKFGASRVKATACAQLTTVLSTVSVPLVMYIASLAF